MIVEINWGNFRAKFNGKEQASFEWLCYLLFCKEFKQRTGISAYKNQAGIETNPVTVNGINIGWQARYYETRLSEHKADFITSIDATKTRHPSVDKIIFYTNHDFGQSRHGTDPQYKTDIESYAKEKDIKIEWRTASYFKSPFVCEENASIAKHFFALGEKSIIDFINELCRHTEAILDPIRSEITFSNKTIKIDRSGITKTLKETISNSPLIVVSGESGVGKTAVIKDFYNQIKDTVPFLVFKAIEFNISNVNQLFTDYGSFTLSDLVQEYQDAKEKYIIVDSAEKLADVERPEVFQEFLSTMRNGGWKIVFTTRLSYLDDLKNAFVQIYNVSFEPLNIRNLTSEELIVLSMEYQFSLPRSDRLQSLLQNPFYLNEYLQNYPAGETTLSYGDFKDAIWNKQIAKSSYRANNTHRKREDCFLEIARKRATSGNFFVTVESCDGRILQRLESDEIIKFDSNARGYFITHDIYEEWALDKLIERAFRKSADHEAFLEDIGSSLAIRRAFRSWLSEKIASDDDDVMTLIEAIVDSARVERHWKDEALVAVLLSDHAGRFIERFEQKLLELPEKVVEEDESSSVVCSFSVQYRYENSLLYRILFLLRIACKEIDQDFLKLLGISKFDGIALSMLVTKPKGQGWKSIIHFLSKYKEELGLMYMHFILPVLDDWNRNHKQGETTKDASKIALFYYDELTKRDGFYFRSRDDTKDKLIRTVFNGSHEIKEDLRRIIDEVVAKKNTSHRGRYYELVKGALSSLMESAEIAKNLPTEVMRLANLFWFYTPDKMEWRSASRIDIAQHFGLSEGHRDYYPASAFQTPVFQLLQTSSQEAIDFILAFTNRSVEYFAKSEFARYEVEEIEVFVDEAGTSIKQYICHRIWNIYRGTQVAPHLLESVHMALERWLLMVVAKFATPEVLEAWCLYLIKNSRSASITAVVASVVLAEPSKLFNVAQVLFRTKEFFFYDRARTQLDMTAKSAYSISYDPEGIFTNERLQTCEDKHRSHTLENQALSYQLFASEDEGEGVARKRQEILWKIFDEYYAQLPDKSKETEDDKTWRLCLARMDRRKMDITTEKRDDGILISFNPEIDPELRQYSETSLAKTSEAMKHVPLQLWSRNRFEGNEEEYKKHPQYENDHKLVISETKKTIEELKDDQSDDGSFTLFYRAVPSYTSAVLIRDYFGQLDANEKEFCKNVILEYASMPLKVGYRYQVGDGVGAAINVLPLLLKPFVQDSKAIKEILLFTLFDSYPIGMSQRLSDYAVAAVLHNLWKESAEDAHSIFLGYLLLKPKFDELSRSIIEENRKKNVYDFSHASAVERFGAKYRSELTKVVSNQLTYTEIPSLSGIDPGTLVTAFLSLPEKTADEDHKKFVRGIFPILSKSLRNNDREERLDYALAHRFLEKLAHFVLSSKKEDIEPYLRPFIEDFGSSRETGDIFSEFIMAEDGLNEYESFWTVWSLFYPKIVELCQEEDLRHHSTNIVHNYLFAWPYWRKDAKEWHSLKEREKGFFKRVAEDIGGHPAVLYSLSKFLNEIGSGFVSDGILWISDMLKKNQDLAHKELEVNTVYYLESLVRGYILKNRYRVRTTPQIKKQILVVLNFLLEKGSVTAYMLREDIL
ncbi:MAG: AVAST type 4 anti-phage nuclease Avs4 [Candidatus Binatia bacterium]